MFVYNASSKCVRLASVEQHSGYEKGLTEILPGRSGKETLTFGFLA